MSLGWWIARRLLQGLLVVVGVSVVVFVVTHMIGDPARLILPLDASQEQYEQARERLGQNDPLWEQFARYAASVLQGDFGNSIWRDEPAMRVALSTVWPTVQLALAAVAIGALLGVPAGFLAAVRANSFVDRILNAFALTGVSVANFWLGLMLILVFAVWLRWLPTSGYGGDNLVLPALAAAAFPFGLLMQVARTAMLDELRQPYVVAARAKGLSRSSVVLRHAVRNALVSVTTMAGFEIGRIMAGGIVVIEGLFAWPGLGQLTLSALNRHDFPLIQACILLVALLVVAVNLLVDMLYGFIDPRIARQ